MVLFFLTTKPFPSCVRGRSLGTQPTTASDSVSQQLNPQVTDDRPVVITTQQMFTKVEERPAKLSETWRMYENPNELLLHMKYTVLRWNIHWVGLTSDETQQEETLVNWKSIATETIPNVLERGKGWLFKMKQNLVWTPNGINPQWPLTLYHKLQVKQIHNAITWRLKSNSRWVRGRKSKCEETPIWQGRL